VVHHGRLIGSSRALLKPSTRLWHAATPAAKIGPMPVQPKAHPDRAAATLAQLDATAARRPAGPFALPGAGAADARIDLKLLQWRALSAMQHSAAARAHLAPFAADQHPDLWAGTVQDGVARGFAVRLEEAIALADDERPALPTAAAATAPSAAEIAAGARVTTGKDLRKRKDVLIASGGARARFTRKEGLLFVDRADEVHAKNCLAFEARADVGTLDGFAGRADERARLFSAQFLQPQRLVESPAATELELAGRLGRGPIGWPCRLVLRGDPARSVLQLVVRIDHRLPGWRLRARFLGLPGDEIAHECTPVREVVQNDAGGFVAFTLVRAATELLVDEARVPTPGAACLGPIEHTFWLGRRDS
jgi:hypothetical protein